MYNPIFITATNTNVGKTYTTIKLIQALSSAGIRVGVYKPIETGVIDVPQDGSMLYQEVCKYNQDFLSLSVDDVVTYQFALPASVYVAKDKEINKEYIKSHIKHLYNYCDILLIEGAGGLMVPIERDFFMIDLIDYIGAKALLVTSDRLGCINDTLLSINCLKTKNIAFEWVVNMQNQKDFFDITYPFYKDYFQEIFILQNDTNKLLNRLLNKDF